VAEFNIYADAEAAAMVFDRGLNPMVLSWEVTAETPILWDRWDRLVASGPVGRRFVAPMIAELARRTHERERPGILMPDPLAMAALLDPGCAASYTAALAVDTGTGPARGMTAVDRRLYSTRPHNARIIETIESQRFEALIERAFRMECYLAREVA
jgi:purine nucleosidase